MSERIVWVHGDALSLENEAIKANPGAPAVFVFDDELLEEYNLSLKRLVFLYECLLELPVTIRRGNVAVEVLRFAKEHGAEKVDTTLSVSPRFAKIAETLSAELREFRALRQPEFVDAGPYDLKRFSRYWRRASSSALRPTRSFS